jgi:short-subunit dehydrogenase
MTQTTRKTAVITGATSGIGMAASLALLHEGWNLFLIGRKFDHLMSSISAISTLAARVNYIIGDLSADEDLRKITNQINAEAPSVDLLLHSAGVIHLGGINELKAEQFDEQYKVNLRAPYILTRDLLPVIELSGGIIIFINSTAGLNSWKNTSQYSATKHGLRAFADSLSAEVREKGIKVVNIFPGATDTPMQEQIQAKEGNRYDPEKYLPAVLVANTIIQIVNQPQISWITDLTIKPF